MEGLALGGGVGVVSALHQPVAGEAGVGDLGQDGVVLAGDTWDVDLEAAVTGLVTCPGPGVVTELSRAEGETGTENCNGE